MFLFTGRDWREICCSGISPGPFLYRPASRWANPAWNWKWNVNGIPPFALFSQKQRFAGISLPLRTWISMFDELDRSSVAKSISDIFGVIFVSVLRFAHSGFLALSLIRNELDWKIDFACHARSRLRYFGLKLLSDSMFYPSSLYKKRNWRWKIWISVHRK